MDKKDQRMKDALLQKLRKVMKKGDKKSSTFAAEEALKFYRRSLDNLEKQPETPEIISNKVEMRLLLGEILFILGKWDPALSYLRKVQDMGAEKAGSAQVAEAYRKSGNLWALKGDIDQTFEDYRKALDLSKKIKDPIGIADSERGLGYAYWRRGNITEAEKHYQAAFKALKGKKDQDLLAKTYLESGNVYNDKGDLDKAVDYYMKAIRVFRKTKDLYQEARTYNNLGDVCIKRKDWKKGIRYFEKTATLSDSINDLHMQGWALFNAGECHAKGGNLEEAEECCTKALDMLSRIDDKIGIAYVFCNYGIVYRFKKEWAKSTKYFKFSLNIVKNLKTPGLEAYVLKEYAEMLNDWGKKEKAKEQTMEAMKIYSGMGAKYYVEEMNELLARIEGRDYAMDIKLSETTIKVMDEESEGPSKVEAPKVQEPVVLEEAIGDDGKVQVGTGGTRKPILAIEEEPKVETPKEAALEPPTTEILVPPEAPKVYLFMPPSENDALRRQKVRFFVELPFIAPEVEVEEITQGVRDDLANEWGVTEYPSLVLFGKVFPGLPSVKDLTDVLRSHRMELEAVTGKAKAVKAPPKPMPAKVANVEPKPSSEKVDQAPAKKKAPARLKYHYSYAVEEEGHDRSYTVFKEMLDRSAKGLVVTRPPVRKLKDQFGIGDAEFYLISTADEPRKGQYRIKDLEDLTHQIEIFMESHDTSVVLLDRVEVIIGHASFDRFLRMLHALNECLDSCQSCLIVPLDPHLIGNIEMRTLKRELTPL
jgi:tetratricopeptide (TPR) repeat protein